MKPIKKTDSDKPWNRRKKAESRKRETVQPSRIIYIFSEGTKTEVIYFKSFPVLSAQVTAVGLGLSRTELIKESIKRKNSILQNSPKSEKKKYSFWCVYDQDIELTSLQVSNEERQKDFDDAFTLGRENELNLAYSNDSFELWFLLHYQYHDTVWTRKEYYRKLSDLWNINYEKEGKKEEFCLSIYNKLSEKQNNAITNARKLFEEQSDLNPSLQNPCTLVYRLVELLNKHIRK
ncbi:MAG TPA: RloB family protein [Leptospiraceae bacterium]|nr:RloB family protein [Leptospiraceae bacterium]HMY68807.1 RloB family protein [Leptospiraceae bacterium]HMZ60622.1 RloB family protein [Leptospiraceae bacterium]HNF13960.1 RloB family protein [Leptospiraceae bacterium]HNF26424.1 RloB family protein [Leptospiraceae bacterium]